MIGSDFSRIRLRWSVVERRWSPVAAVLVILATAAAGCAADGGAAAGAPTPVAGAAVPDADPFSKAVASAAAAATPGNAAYRVGPQDVLDITVFKVPDLNRTVQVSGTGSINFPLIGDVPAGGKTAEEIERTLAARLGARYIQSPQVSVFIKEYNSQHVTVEGEVKKPGVYALRGGQSLVQVVAQAGGLDNDTASGQALVFRGTNGQRLTARFDLDEIRAGKSPDPPIVEGDTIMVESSRSKVAFGYFIKALPVATVFRPF